MSLDLCTLELGAYLKFVICLLKFIFSCAVKKNPDVDTLPFKFSHELLI